MLKRKPQKIRSISSKGGCFKYECLFSGRKWDQKETAVDNQRSFPFRRNVDVNYVKKNCCL